MSPDDEALDLPEPKPCQWCGLPSPYCTAPPRRRLENRPDVLLDDDPPPP